MSIQEEINKKTVALVISASKMTGRVLQAAIREYLRQQQKNKNKGYQGKQTIKQLVESGAALSNIEITNKNIKSFEPVAKKYGLDYALRKDNSTKPPKYLVFFKGKDIDVINMAFQEYSQKLLREKPSIRKCYLKCASLQRLSIRKTAPAAKNRSAIYEDRQKVYSFKYPVSSVLLDC